MDWSRASHQACLGYWIIVVAVGEAEELSLRQ